PQTKLEQEIPMSIKTFFKSLISTSRRRRPIRLPASRPCLEALEGRCLLSFLPAVNYPVGSYPNAVVTGPLVSQWARVSFCSSAIPPFFVARTPLREDNAGIPSRRGTYNAGSA